MSKNIPKPIVAIGFSTKKKTSGVLQFELEGNKVKNLDKHQFDNLMTKLDELKDELLVAYGENIMIGGLVMHPTQYNEIKDYINQGRYLQAVKSYKMFTGLGLKDAKDAIDNLISKKKIK